MPIRSNIIIQISGIPIAIIKVSSSSSSSSSSSWAVLGDTVGTAKQHTKYWDNETNDCLPAIVVTTDVVIISTTVLDGNNITMYELVETNSTVEVGVGAV